MISFQKGDLAAAENHFRQAVRHNPDDEVARDFLHQIEEAKTAASKTP